MFEIGSFPARLCQGVSRRAFMRAGAVLPWAIAGAAARANDEARAKSVIFLWLWGAPSHIDTFDPKPNAAAERRGPFSTIATRHPGTQFAEILPRCAAMSDRFTVVRSHKSFHTGHLEAGAIGLTGDLNFKDGTSPNFGSAIARYRGSGDLPGFMSLGRGHPRDVVGVVRGYGGGRLGDGYDPFLVGCNEVGEIKLPAIRLLDGLTPGRLQDRRSLLQQVDRVRRQMETVPERHWDRNFSLAYSLLTSTTAREAMDLSRERPATREAFGATSFGQSCLLARRLVQAGVPYIQVNWSQYVETMSPNCDFGWDTHIFNFEMLADHHGPIFDRAYTALLTDLAEHGLLDSTLVVAMGEFGRTPTINVQAARDHWPNVYFSLWAGAGVAPGRVIGGSDSQGAEPTSEPITPLMVGTTMADRAGLTVQTRAELGVLTGGQVIHELF